MWPPRSPVDQAWEAEPDGTFDRPLTVIVYGIGIPLACLAWAIWIVVADGVTLSNDNVSHHFGGVNAVGGGVAFLTGVALIFVSIYLWPNVFRLSYRYQHIAGIGIALAIGGLIWFVTAALL